MIYAIIGSRNISIAQATAQLEIILTGKEIDGIISGGACGADMVARRYALQNNIPLVEYLPDYQKNQKTAPHIRNAKIVADCDILVALWNGFSNGTKNTMTLARKSGKTVLVWEQPAQDQLSIF